jgi:glycosyltransferase involved in cell wall biosynthesis
VERVAQELSERLAQRGHTTAVLCADVPPRAPTTVNGVPVCRVRAVGKVGNTDITPTLPWHLARMPFDVAHCHLPTPWSADWTCAIARLRRKPVVLTYYNRIVGHGPDARLARLYEALVLPITLRLATAVLVQSDRWHDDLLRRFRSITAKVFVVRNGVDVAFYTPPAEPVRGGPLLFVGVLDAYHAYKGLDVLLRALVACPGVGLCIVGDGSARAAIERRTLELGLAPRVHFRGQVSRDELAGMYRSASLLVMPSAGSEQEGGHSLVVLEALASGLPVIVGSGAGAISETVDGEHIGRAVDAGDVEGLAAAVRALLADEAERAAMGRRAREWAVAHASWDAIIDEVEAVYVRAQATHRAKGRPGGG